MFEENWAEKLNSYQLSHEFKENFKILKEKIKSQLPNDRPEPQQVVFFVGPTGSGKSTFAEYLKKQIPALLISTDWIFFKQLDLDDYYKAYVYRRELLKWALSKQYSVILDSNFRTIRDREDIHQIASQFNAKTIVIKLNVLVETAAKRRTMKAGNKVTYQQRLDGVKKSLSDIEPFTSAENKNYRLIELNTDQPIEQSKRCLLNFFQTKSPE